MATLPEWNTRQFGCVMRDEAKIDSLMRTVVSASLPVPWFSRKGDTAAPLEMAFTIDVDDAGWRAWQQWVTFDLNDGSLPFTIYMPWGTKQPRVRARLLGEYEGARIDLARWKVSGVMQIERESLPRFSGGALA